VNGKVAQHVVLVPGLWMPAAAMTYLAARLAREGYATHLFSYRGRSPFDANVERLARLAREIPRAHFVGHSLGGLLVLETLCRHPEATASSALLIGAPVRGCFAGRRFGLARFGRWMLGASSALWEERPAAWRRREPLGVVAGTAPLGLGRAFGRLPEQNDGGVCVAETDVEGMACRALVPIGHSGLIVSARVARLAAAFLSTGRFE
jgi:pimeloyl-ACP methyl ester carboxylesterase